MTLIAEPVVDSHPCSLFAKERIGEAVAIAGAHWVPLFCGENRKPSFLHRRRPLVEYPDYLTDSSLCLPEELRSIPTLKGDSVAALAMAWHLQEHFSLKDRSVIFCGLREAASLFWCGFLLSLDASLYLWDREKSFAERFAYDLYHESGVVVPVVYRESLHEGVPVLVHGNVSTPFLRNPIIPIHKDSLCFQWKKRLFPSAVMEGVLRGQGWHPPELEQLESEKIRNDFMCRLKENQMTIWRERNLDNLRWGKYNTYN